MTHYEGFCQFCKREIGNGHRVGCPYHDPHYHKISGAFKNRRKKKGIRAR